MLKIRFAKDAFFIVTISIVTFIFIFSFSILFVRPIVLHRIIIPILSFLFSPDGALETSTIQTLDSLTLKAVPFIVFIGFCILLYGLLWKIFSLRLPQYRMKTILPGKKITKLEILFLVIAIVLGLGLRLHGINRGLSYDEIVTAINYVEVESMKTTISTCIAFSNHVANAILARLSYLIFGKGEWVLRLPALLLGIASIYFLWIFAKKLFGPKIAIIATMFLAVSPMHVLYSQSCRGYSGLVFFGIISSYLYLKILDEPKYLNVIYFIFSNIALIYFHLYGIFFPIAQLLVLLFLSIWTIRGASNDCKIRAKSFRFLWVSFPIIVLGSIICYLPILRVFVEDISKRAHGIFNAFFPIDVIRALSGDIGTVMIIAFFSIFLAGIVSLAKVKFKVFLYFIVLLTMPFLVMWFSNPYDLYPRFFIYFLPFYLVISVYGTFVFLELVNKKFKYIFQKLCIITAIIIFALLIVDSSKTRNAGFKETAQFMDINAGDRQTALCAIGLGANLLRYYSKSKIFIPSTMEEFDELKEEYSEIICAYRKSTLGSNEHTKIGRFLLEKTTPKEMYDFMIFRYHK